MKKALGWMLVRLVVWPLERFLDWINPHDE